MVVKRIHKSYFVLFIIFILTTFGFQNCSPNFYTTSDSSSFEKTTDSGNGGGYEGKIEYYRFVPDLTCSGQKAYKEMLVIEQNSVWLFENQKTEDSCLQTKTQLDISELNTSPFQNELLVVRDYLYALYDLGPLRAPELLAESLCRDNWENPKFEIANHYNYKTGEATTRIYYFSNEGKQILSNLDTSTSRLLTPFEVKYNSFNQQLKYELNLTNGTGRYSRRYSGAVTYVDPSLSSAIREVPLACVTGGGLDASIWPVKKVEISPTISNFFVHPTENDIYYEDRNPKSVNWWRPFVLKNETTPIDISASIFKTSMYVGSNLPIANSSWMTLEGVETNGTPYFGGNVYIYRPEDPASLRTLVRNQSTKSFIPNQNLVTSKITQLSETEFGYWVTNRTYSSVNTPAVDKHFYRVFNWQTGKYNDYLTAKPAYGVAQSLYFNDQKQPTGIVGNIRSSQDGKFEVFYMDINLRKEQIRPLPDIPNCTPVPQQMSDLERSFISKESRMAIIELACPNNARKVLGLSIDTGFYYLTGENDTLVWTSADGETFMVGEKSGYNYNPSNVRIVDAKNGRVEASKMDPHLQNSLDTKQFEIMNTMYYGGSYFIKTFTKDKTKYITAFTAGSRWSIQLKNLDTRIESTVCTNVLGEKLALVNFSDEQVALVTFDPGQRILIYEVSESTSCKLLNSAPVKYKAIRVLAPTKSGLGVGVSASPGSYSYMQTNSPDDIYFLNKDGRAPLHINLNNSSFSVVIDMQVSTDHSKLYILGKGMQSSIYQNLFWLGL
jgi:hypothetical protein